MSTVSRFKHSLFVALTVALILLLTATAGAQIGPKGRLFNGSSVKGFISQPFQIKEYAFFAKAGEGIFLNTVELGGLNFDPQVNIYRPDGTLQLWDWGPAIIGVGFTATQTGVYTLSLKDYRSGGGTGVYEIHYGRAPGANEHGELVNGGKVSGTIEFGDVDSYTVTANPGDNVLLRAVDLGGVNFEPQINVYKPDGSLQLWDYGQVICGVSFTANIAGPYTVMLRDYRSGGGTAPYEIHCVRTPGANEHGELTSGTVASEFIELGDLDSFTFTVNQGDTFQLQATDMGGTNFEPQMNIYRPDGSLQNWTWGNNVATFGMTAGSTGTYTVVVMDYQNGGGTGPYELLFTIQ